MKSTVENLESTKVKLTVEVPYEELKKDMDAAYKEIANQVNVPGFRRGKVPPRIIDQRFSREAVIQQVINDVMPRLYSEAVVEKELHPLGQPQIEVTGIPNTTGEYGGTLEFVAEIPVVPPFELPDISAMEVEVDPLSVTDEDVDVELDELRGRFASLKPIKRKAKKGDFATIDMVARIGDEEVDSVSDVSYEIGSKSMLDGMDKALTGMKADEETIFTTTLAGGEHEGEEAEVTINVKAMKTRELPKADDDFAQMVSEFDTIDELREDLRTQAGFRKRNEQAVQARERLLDKIIEATEIELPKSTIDAELAERLGEDAKKSEKTKMRKEITRQITEQLILDQLAKEREVEISQQEFFDFMMQTAQAYGMDPSQLFQDQSQVQAMVGELARTKSIVHALGEVKITDTEGNDVDLTDVLSGPQTDEVTDDEAGEAEESAESAESGE